jgi:hypothetical protein
MFCRLFRFMISSAADSGGPIGPATGRHIAHCEGCRQFLLSCQQLAEGLRSEAARWEQGSGQPCCRVLASRARMPGSSHSLPVRVALAAAACIAIVAAAALSLMTSPRPTQAPATTMAVAFPASPQWTAKWVEIVQTPLVAEAENLRSDAQSGIRFLAACLDVRPVGVDVPVRPGDAAPSSQP